MIHTPFAGMPKSAGQSRWKPALRSTLQCLGAALVWAGCFCAARSATDESAYAPAGAPADPKVSVRWDRYYDYAETTKTLKALVAAHPQRAKLQSLGKSYQGREMWLLTLTNFAAGKADEKPAYWIHAGIHANEIQGVEVAMYTAWYLLEMYGRSPLVTRLLDERTFYILPMISPDSRDAHMHEPNTTSSPRSGAVPVDDDRDGLLDEDDHDDLDGDGHITEMRIRDPNGRWKAHPKYPNLMVRAAPDERGEFTLLGPEGFDNDGDGLIDEDGVGSYDPNRDWPYNWQPRYVQRGAYRYPLSLLENRVAADFIAAHPNVAGAQTYHNSGGMILRGPELKQDQYDSADVAVYDAIAKTGEQILPGYKYTITGRDLYEVYGGEGEWLYEMRGVFRFTTELFPSFNYFRKTTDSAGRQEESAAFDRYLLLGDGTVPWHEVEHPQYGRIEVGGRKKNWGRQPPSFLLEEECHRNMAFTLYHADQMPKVSIQSAAARRTRSGLVEVTVCIANERLTPTHAAVDVKHKITPPDIVAISGSRLKVVLGLRANDRFFEKASEQKREPQRMQITNVPGMDAVYVRWLVQGDGPYTVTLRSVKGGSDRRELQ